MPLQANNSLLEARKRGTWIESAEKVSVGSNCIRRSVGAILVRENRIIAEGWNGVSGEFADCREAGCPRCTGGGKTGSGYENCICIHAEQSAIAEAAKKGISSAGSTMYVTLRPCLQCLAISIAGGVKQIFYSGEEWEYDAEVESVYHVLSGQLETFERIDKHESSIIAPSFQFIDGTRRP